MIRSVTADDVAIQALSNEGAQCGDCGDQPGDRICPRCEKCRARYIAALRAIGWGPVSEIQDQINAATTELAAVKRQIATLARLTKEGTR